MKVIVNADDFGLSKGVNLGILEGFNNGVLTSTSLMTNMPGFTHAIELMKENPKLKVGLHLVMTVGKALSKDLKTIVDEEGNFIRSAEVIQKGDFNEIKREYRAQLNTFLESGFTPTHMDFHVMGLENQYKAAIELAEEYKIPLRAMTKEVEEICEKRGIIHSRNFNQEFYGEGVSKEGLIRILEENKNKDLIEIMCHPAYVDSTLLKNSSYRLERTIELEILTSSEVKTFIKENNITLINYSEI